MRVGRADGDAWLRLGEAASVLGISLNTLRRWSDSGRLACYRSPGGHRRYRRRDIEALLRHQAGSASAAAHDLRTTHSPRTDRVRLDESTLSALAALARVAGEGVGVSSCVLAVVDDDALLRVVAHYGESAAPDPPAIGTILDRGHAPVADEVRHTRNRVLIASTEATDLLCPDDITVCRARGDAAILALPLVVGRRLLGVMQLVERDAPRTFTAANVAFAELVGRQVARLIANDVDGEVASAPKRGHPTGESDPVGAVATAAPTTLVAADDERRVTVQPPKRGAAGDATQAAILQDDEAVEAFLRIVDALVPGGGRTVYTVGEGVATPVSPRGEARAGNDPSGAFALDDEPQVGRLLADGRADVVWRGDGLSLIVPLAPDGDTADFLEVHSHGEGDLRDAARTLEAAAALVTMTRSARALTDVLGRRLQDLEATSYAGIEDAAQISSDEVLRAVVKRLSELTRSPVVDVYAVESTTLRALISFDGGRFDREWEGVVVPLSRYPCSLRAVETGETAIASCLDDEILGSDGRFSLERWGYQSQLSLPLTAGGRVIGLIELSDYVPRDFREDLELIRGLGRIAAQSLENARLSEQVERRGRILNELVDLGSFASLYRDFDSVLGRVAERLVHTLEAANCDIYKATDDGLRCAVSYDRSGLDERAVGRLLDVTTYPTVVAAIAAGRLLVVTGPDDPQLSESERAVYREYGFNSEVCVPLVVNDELFGLIDIYDTRARDFSDYLDFLRNVGMALAGAFASTLLLRRLEHRTAVLREVVRLGADAAQGGDLRPLLSRIAEGLRTTMDAADCDIWVLDDATLVCLASVDARGPDDEAVDSVIQVADYPVLEMALRMREPVAVADLADPRVTDDERRDYAAWGFRSLISIPLISADDVVGIVDVFDVRERDYDEYLDFARSVGQITAGAIRNAGLLDELTTRNRQLAELVELGHLATSASGLTSLLEAVTGRVSQVVGAAGCQVFVPDGGDLRCLFTWEDGAPNQTDMGHAIDLEHFPTTRRALESREILVVERPDQPGLTEAELAHYRDTEWRSDILVPLTVENRLVGLLEVYDRRPRTYHRHRDFLRQAGQVLAGALENIQLVERLEQVNAHHGHLVEAGLEFGATLEPDAVLRSVADRLCLATRATTCDIYRVEGDDLHCLVSVDGGVFDQSIAGSTYRLADFAGVRDVIAEGRPLAVRDVVSDGRISELEREESLRRGHRSKVELPLVARGGVVGLAAICDDKPRDFGDLKLLQSLGQVAANAIANATLYDALDRSADRVALVGDVSFELSSSLDLAEVLRTTAERLCALADMPRCDLYTLDADRRLTCVVSLTEGRTDAAWQGGRVRLDNWSAVRTAVDRRMPITIASLDDRLLNDEERTLMKDCDETAKAIFPLISKDVVIGVLVLLETRGPRAFDADEVATISAVCRVAALAIHNADLYHDIKRMHLGNLKALSSALNAKDYYTLGHAARVAAYMVLLGEELGWPSELLATVEEAAYLHDVGKIGVSDRVLSKPSGLNPREWELMRKHPVSSADIIRPLFDDDLVAGVRHHHERYDGEGYPDGLAGEAIPVIAKAMCVADSYDAMSFRRPYRAALSYTACREELARCSGSQFDPETVAAFERVLDRLAERKATAVDVAAEAAARLDGATHATLRRIDDEGSEAYQKVVATLRAVRDAHPPTRYLTTFARRGAATILVADAEEDEALRSHIGDESFSDEELFRAFIDEPLDRTALFVDRYGVWISGAAAVRDERGDIVAVVNADLPAISGAAEIGGPRSDVTQTFSTLAADAAADLGRVDLEAITDTLTGLHNHRYLHERLAEEIERCLRQNSSLALLLLDVDDFRTFNDRYGHSVGDRALRAVAGAIESSLRQTDVAARFGGEEFAVILVDADEEGAREVAERIRNSILETEVTLAHGTLSVSIGMALCPADASHKDELLDKADWAMYLAKRRGRDRVVSFGVEHGSLTPEQALTVHGDHVRAVGAVVEARDAYLRRRRAAVTHLALAAARQLGLRGDEMRAVAVAASSCVDRGIAVPVSTTVEKVAVAAAAYEQHVTAKPYRPQISEAEALGELRSSSVLFGEPELAAAFETVLNTRRL